MSILNILTRKAPSLGAFEFDAVLEDTLELSVNYTQYPIESGAFATDHGIIEPFRWRMIGAVSNNPLKTQLADFTGFLTELLPDSGAIASVPGWGAGLLSGSDDTRASNVLQLLITLMVSRTPFDIDASDIQLSNMVISDLTRTKDPTVEGGLVFDAQLQELPTLDTVIRRNADTQPSQRQLADEDKAGLAGVVDKGEQALEDVGTAVNNAVDNVLGAF